MKNYKGNYQSSIENRALKPKLIQSLVHLTNLARKQICMPVSLKSKR